MVAVNEKTVVAILREVLGVRFMILIFLDSDRIHFRSLGHGATSVLNER